MKTFIILAFSLITQIAYSTDLLLENEEWLYKYKLDRLEAVKDLKHKDAFLAANVVLTTWQMSDGSVVGAVAPFMAELWISRTEDVMFYFQSNPKSFEKWLRIQEGILLGDPTGGGNIEELEDLHARRIKHLNTNKSPFGEWNGTKFQKRYLEKLKSFTVKEVNR